LVARWGLSDGSEEEKTLTAAGCDRVVADVGGAVKSARSLIERGRKEDAAAEPAASRSASGGGADAAGALSS
jgi:hypothetical protein